jgi:hypothetical protein
MEPQGSLFSFFDLNIFVITQFRLGHGRRACEVSGASMLPTTGTSKPSDQLIPFKESPSVVPKAVGGWRMSTTQRNCYE